MSSLRDKLRHSDLQEAKQRAADWQRANKSDPFAGAVALAHFKCGVARVREWNKDGELVRTQDYTCEFHSEPVDPSMPDSPKRTIAKNLVRV